MPIFFVGDRTFVFMPAAKTGKAHKLARPFHGLFRILKRHDNGAEVQPVDKLRNAPIRVSFDCLRVCLDEVPSKFWLRSLKSTAARTKQTSNGTQLTSGPPVDKQTVWEGPLPNEL